MHRLETYPLDHPNANRISMNRMSELINGGAAELEACCTLHARKRGMNNVRAIDKAKSLRADHTMNRGNAHVYLPRKSPTLNIRK